tara:strand:- start:3005 stop:3226 length:222 start_codon:yes stop_codon:yes gene_type:complete
MTKNTHTDINGKVTTWAHEKTFRLMKQVNKLFSRTTALEQRFEFELNEIHLSLESLEERLKELISQRGNSHKD